MCMIKYINEILLPEQEKRLNLAIMRKEYDLPLIEYIKDVWKSLEVVKNIEILGFDYNEDESNIDINRYIRTRGKKKSAKERVKYKFINDERYAVLTVRYKVTAKAEDAKPDESKMKETIREKRMLIPVIDSNGFMYLKGKRYSLWYQLVEKSTYTTKDTVTLKSLMPIGLKRSTSEIKDIDGHTYKVPIYEVYVFKKPICVLSFYAAYGLSYALDYLHVKDVIKFVSSVENPEHKIYFQISTKVFLEVDKEIFDKMQYVQAIVGMLLEITTNRLKFDLIDDRVYWIKKLGGIQASYDKGKDILVFFSRMLDETTKKILLLEPYDKQDIYSLIRYMMMNFTELRKKDNLDLMNKRLRCNEYIASLLTAEFSRRLNRIITKGGRATSKDFDEIFSFPGDILLIKMHSSGILRYDDTINSMDFFNKFRITMKGPHSLGNKNEVNITDKQRGIDPSYIGYLDLLVCGASDPGTSGVLTPFNDMKSLYFNDDPEPNDCMFNLHQAVQKMLERDGVTSIDIHASDKETYYKLLNSIQEFNKNEFRVYASVAEDTVMIDKVISDDDYVDNGEYDEEYEEEDDD